ncbi:MAG TPA: hypothetical protein DCZ92_03040 [Elusimicrobia bacterium]|nr:hypothetical protein [Elusimicrobiota bacterium]
MNVKNKYAVSIMLSLGGLAVWVLITALTHKREAWDSGLFWSMGVPAILLMNAIAGFLEPERIVLKGIISVSLQPVAMTVKAGEIGSMFPMGLIVFVILGLFFSIGGGAGVVIKNAFFAARTGNPSPGGR